MNGNHNPINTMKTKRMYIAPECMQYPMPAGWLCQSIKVSGDEKVTNGDHIGFSKSYGGTIWDDGDAEEN